MMNIINRIKRKFETINAYRYVKKREELQRTLETPTESNCIYFFCTPTHSNLGDQAQLYCWLKLMKEWYPNHNVICIPTQYRQFKTIRTIRNYIKDGDLILIHSGYLIFDPHPELPFILDVVRAFYDKHIVILPQTVNLVNTWYQQVVARTFNAHSNLCLICRDEVSLKNTKQLFPHVKLLQMPDVVTSLIGDTNYQYRTHRNGVMLCVRNDGEKLYSKEQIDTLKSRFNDTEVSVGDTTIDAHLWKWEKERETLILDLLKKMASYQVIITDRYHGTIFSLTRLLMYYLHITRGCQ